MRLIGICAALALLAACGQHHDNVNPAPAPVVVVPIPVAPADPFALAKQIGPLTVGDRVFPTNYDAGQAFDDAAYFAAYPEQLAAAQAQVPASQIAVYGGSLGLAAYIKFGGASSPRIPRWK